MYIICFLHVVLLNDNLATLGHSLKRELAQQEENIDVRHGCTTIDEIRSVINELLNERLDDPMVAIDCTGGTADEGIFISNKN